MGLLQSPNTSSCGIKSSQLMTVSFWSLLLQDSLRLQHWALLAHQNTSRVRGQYLFYYGSPVTLPQDPGGEPRPLPPLRVYSKLVLTWPFLAPRPPDGMGVSQLKVLWHSELRRPTQGHPVVKWQN